ncbi:coiled-coil domain-containing protein 42B, partial [Asbolus verrucosus]
FIISNEEKRQRARERRQEDYNLRMERTAEIEKLQQKFAETLESKAEMEQNISALKMFEDYLNQVVGESIDFKNADDLLRRYDALVSTRNELGKRQDATLRELEAARLKTARMAEENGFVILGLNNIVADLRGRYNTATRQALHWETVVYNIKDCMYEKIQEMNEVKQACWNTYLLMCKRKADQPKFEEEDYEKQLVYIKKTLQEVKTVKKLALGSSTRINSMKPRTKSIS